jgi:hypothetical protein
MVEVASLLTKVKWHWQNNIEIQHWYRAQKCALKEVVDAMIQL